MNLEHFEGFGAAKNREELHKRMLAVTHLLDFELFALVVAEKVHTGTSYVSLTNAPDEWVERSKDNSLAVADPVHTHLRNSPKPIVWNQDTYVKAGAGAQWEMSAPYGYKVGIAVTFPLGPSRRLMIGIDRHHALPSDPAKTVSLIGSLQLLAAFGQNNQAIEDMFPTKPLTPQQQKVMALVAAGKSNTVIADILGISVDTVGFHIKAVFARLGVSTRQQAVLEIERLNLIPDFAT
jgi:DNA-binding CsgD family transcriptional regulator